MRDHRGLEIGVVAALAVAFVGLVSGVESSGREVASYVDDAPTAASAPEIDARSYRDLRRREFGPNAGRAASWWQTVRGETPDLFAEIAQTPAERDEALATRASRRAYDGAPPTIPHAVDQLGVPGCVACHAGGAVVAGRVAPVMSHAVRDSCLQCHVVAADPRIEVATPAPPATDFAGLAAPSGGERAWPGAPPTIPHSTWMRERCDGCHGVRGLHGMRSTHPWRASCTQCHAPSAVLDQRAPAALDGTP